MTIPKKRSEVGVPVNRGAFLLLSDGVKSINSFDSDRSDSLTEIPDLAQGALIVAVRIAISGTPRQ